MGNKYHSDYPRGELPCVQLDYYLNEIRGVSDFIRTVEGNKHCEDAIKSLEKAVEAERIHENK